jgi:hypothetical protein
MTTHPISHNHIISIPCFLCALAIIVRTNQKGQFLTKSVIDQQQHNSTIKEHNRKTIVFFLNVPHKLTCLFLPMTSCSTIFCANESARLISETRFQDRYIKMTKNECVFSKINRVAVGHYTRPAKEAKFTGRP